LKYGSPFCHTLYIYIYIYIERERERGGRGREGELKHMVEAVI
jgi:hypothetical protein